MTTRAVLDVANVPEGALDHRAPIWWGNVLLLLIESTMFVLLVASYLYIHSNYEMWPPPRVDRGVVIYNPLPDLLFPTLNVLALVIGVIPMRIADRAAHKMNEKRVRNGTAIAVLFGIMAITFRFFEFSGLHFRWDDNAYASAVWGLLFLHLIHHYVILVEDTLMLAWVTLKGLDHSHARDVRATAIYWYWVAAIWIPIYVLIYWGPRFM